MPVPVVMPQLGESVVEGTITRWLVKAGDTVTKDQAIVSVATDKADSDVPSPVAGVVVALLAPEGATVATNTPIAEIDTVGAQTATVASKPADVPLPLTTPAVRQALAQHGIDPATVTGTGERGRITRQDVVNAARERSEPAVSVAPPASPASLHSTAPTEAPAVPVARAASGGFTLKPYVPAPGDEVVPFNRRRRIIADHMVYSKRVAPHVYTFAEIDMHRVSRLRDARREALKSEGVSLTFLAFVAAATARALRENPLLNSRVLDDAFVKLRRINLGVAVETSTGLLVPVVKGADELTVKGLARTIDDLARKARDGQVEADDLSGATFTISNPGLKGNFVGAAVISQPNVGILRTGEIVKRPVVVEVDGVDTIAIHPVMFVALSYDHRVVDGVAANNFLFRITELLEGGQFEV